MLCPVSDCGLCLHPLRQLGQPAAGLECQPAVERHGVEPEEVAVQEVDNGVPGDNTGGRLSSVLQAVVTVLQLEGGSHLIHLSLEYGPPIFPLRFNTGELSESFP